MGSMGGENENSTDSCTKGFYSFNTCSFNDIKKKCVDFLSSTYLCEESQGVVSTLGGHLSDQVLGAVLQQLLFNGVPTLQPG